jgi:DNA primase
MMTDLFEEVKNRYEIVSFISQFVKLKKVGKNYVGLCPFHSERTPSFTVSPDKQIFKCFGCGAAGDVVTFYMKYKNLEFREALLELAEKAGIKVDKRYFSSKQKERDLIEINFKIAKLYQHFLWNHPSGEKARGYLKERGISEETARFFHLGYAPSEGRVLASLLRAQNISLDLAVEAGLLKKGEDGSYLDVFRDRLIFPIFNEKGECVGFGGRTLDPEGEPKYLNSPESKVFKKSEVLYGLFQSKEYIKKEGAVFLVEGYFDYLALWERGIKNLSATCGTALTEHHLKKLKLLTEEWYILYDGDEAGRKAALRATSLILKEGFLPRVILLPEGEDPDSFAKKYHGKNLLEELNKRSLEGIKFIWEFYKEEYQKSPSKVFREIIELLKGVSDPLLLKRISRELSYYFGINETDIERRLKIEVQEEPSYCPSEGIDREECYLRIIAQYLVNYPEDWPFLERIGLKQLIDENSEKPYHRFLRKFMEVRLAEISLFEIPDPEFQEILSDLLLSPPFDDKEEVFKDIVHFIETELKKREIRQLVENLKVLEKMGNKEEIESYLLKLKSTIYNKEIL